MKLVIGGTLPTMNEIIDAAKGSKYTFRALKEQYDNLVAWHAKAQKLQQIEKADFTITWICPDKRYDKDNIMAGQKFIFDGLQVAGVLKNDGWKQIGKVIHDFEVDRQNPRVEIEIMEVGA